MSLSYRRLSRALLAATFTMSLLGSPAAFGDEQKVDEGKRLLQAGKAQAAYDVLKPLEEALSGQPRFDYLLGLAAMDSGRPVEALFALERAVAVAPQDPLIRVAYTNALLGANEEQAAKEQEKIVRDQVAATRETPDGVLQGLDRYVESLGKPGFGQTTDFRGYVGVAMGYDSNVNNSTNQKVISTALGSVTLPSTATQKSDLFATFLTGGSVIHPLRRDLSLNAAISANHRMLESVHSFETTSLQANADLTYLADEKTSWSGGIFAQYSAVHMDANRTSFGFLGRGRFALDARSESSLFVQYTRNQYPTEIRDSNRYVFGVGYKTLLPLTKDPVLSGRVFFGREQQDESQVPHLGHNVVGASLNLSMTLAPKYSAYLDLRTERRDYLGSDPIFGFVRTDSFYQATIGMAYLPAKHWQVQPRVSYGRNISNRAISDFAFTTAQVSIIRSFN